MRILIVDDETPIREWIQFSIERGADPAFKIVGTAQDGAEAYELAVRERPDLIITDIKMPGMDGLELIRKLKKELPYTAYIVLTGYAEFSYAQEAVNLGAKQYFLKSELSGTDILKTLTELKQQQEKELKGLRGERYSNGFLDIFCCDVHREDTTYLKAFWKRHSFLEENPFLIMALPRVELETGYDWIEEGEKKSGRDWIETFLSENSIQKNGQSYFVQPVLRKEAVFVLMQAETKEALEQKSILFYTQLRKRLKKTCLAVSCIEVGVERIEVSMREAEQLLDYSFFLPEGRFSFDLFSGLPDLNKEVIRHSMQLLKDNLLYVEKEQFLLQTEQFFSLFERVSVQDIAFARDACLRLCAQLEEAVREYLSVDEGETERLHTFEEITACRAFCRKQIERLYSEENFRYSPGIRQAIQYIHQHYQEQSLSLTEVAQAVYRSPEYLSRRFKVETGKNFSAYLTMHRLDQAKQLLMHSDLKIYEIAEKVGYVTPSYFSKIYRDYMGITPEMARLQRTSGAAQIKSNKYNVKKEIECQNF